MNTAALLPFGEILGFWLSIFLTFCILSFLYKDNPFYKMAEHLFIGVSIGYVVVQQYHDVLEPKMVDRVGGVTFWMILNVILALAAVGAALTALKRKTTAATVVAVILSAGFIASIVPFVSRGEASELLSRTSHVLWWIGLVPLALFAMMLIKSVSPRWSWMGRYPLAFVVALYAALEVNGLVQADLGAQMKLSMQDVSVQKVDVNSAPPEALMTLPGVSAPVARAIVAHRDDTPFTSLDQIEALPELSPKQRELLEGARGHLVGLDARAATEKGEHDLFGIFSRLFLLLGLLSSLIYFYFSIEQKGPVGKVSRFGVWVLMIGFGASFGYTVQGRLALAIGRAIYVLDKDKSAALAARVRGPLVSVISIAIIVIGIALWEARQRRKAGGGGSGSASPGSAGA